MTFPQSDRVVYAEDILQQVVCALKFPPILSIGAEPPSSFQERIRTTYPLYERHANVGMPPEIESLLEKSPIKPPPSVAHIFRTEDGSRSITLTADTIAVTEEAYSQWE